MRLSCSALFVALTSISSCAAFQAIPSSSRARVSRPLSAVAIDPTTTTTSIPTGNNNEDDNDKNRKGGMMVDLEGIAFSGLKGQALSWAAEDMPKANEVRAVIPKDCFEPETARSLGYLSVSTIGTAICTAVGVSLQGGLLSPENPLTWPLWAAYSAVTGTVAMGLWVLAHECGHGAFSKDKKLQDTVGYIIHSIMLVPYYSWQRSHAVHHQYTNHIELGETHVPEINEEGNPSLPARDGFIQKWGTENGMKAWGSLQAFLHLIVGWPAYLLIGATGGQDRGMTNHFLPDPLTEPNQPKKELFPGNWKEKVLKSDIGIAAVVGIVAAWTFCNGPAQVMALYGGPLLVINAWLVLYTWLQHTDTDVPHFSQDDEYSFIRGALHTIDRPYDKLDPWGIIDFLHHKIGTTHVAHHFDSTIPHYKAQVATDAIKEAFPEYYLYDPTPIPQAMWRIAKGCTAVEKRGDRYVWNNQGVEDQVEVKQQQQQK